MRLILSSFKQSLKFAPAVLKDSTIYFGIYFFVFGFILLALFQKFTSAQASPFAGFFNQGLLFLASAFTVFIIPYYAFKYSQGSAPKFWDFIKDNIWPVVFAHIKAFFVILFFLLLLILPGLYKGIRFSFLTETVLFDKQSQPLSLKQAQLNTKGYFWKIVLFLIVSSLASFTLSWLTKIISSTAGSHFLISWLSLILLFYLKCFIMLWKIQLFFEIKKEKGEKISC